MEGAFNLIHGIIRTDAADAPAATPAPALPAALTAMDCTTLPKASKQGCMFNHMLQVISKRTIDPRVLTAVVYSCYLGILHHLLLHC